MSNGFYANYHRFRRLERSLNKHLPLLDYFGPMMGDKKSAVIADVGSGPFNTIGDLRSGVDVKLYLSDVAQPEYRKIWENHNIVPLFPVEYQNMENLTYQDNMFDIVHCKNALDHTSGAEKALEKFIKVCAKGGWIYLRHYPNQRTIWRGHHCWDINFIEGEGCVFKGENRTFNIKDFGNFKSRVAEDGSIVSVCQK